MAATRSQGCQRALHSAWSAGFGRQANQQGMDSVHRSSGSWSAWTRSCASGTPSTSADAGASLSGWLFRGLAPKKVKEPFLSWVYMRTGPDGKKAVMPLREQLLWGAGFVGLALIVLPRVERSRQRRAEDEAQGSAQESAKALELETKRKASMYAVLNGNSFLSEDDPFDGMTPKEIAAYIKKHCANLDDPFEGMTPEEIDEYAAKFGLNPS